MKLTKKEFINKIILSSSLKFISLLPYVYKPVIPIGLQALFFNRCKFRKITSTEVLSKYTAINGIYQ